MSFKISEDNLPYIDIESSDSFFNLDVINSESYNTRAYSNKKILPLLSILFMIRIIYIIYVNDYDMFYIIELIFYSVVTNIFMYAYVHQITYNKTWIYRINLDKENDKYLISYTYIRENREVAGRLSNLKIRYPIYKKGNRKERIQSISFLDKASFKSPITQYEYEPWQEEVFRQIKAFVNGSVE